MNVKYLRQTDYRNYNCEKFGRNEALYSEGLANAFHGKRSLMKAIGAIESTV